MRIRAFTFKLQTPLYKDRSNSQSDRRRHWNTPGEKLEASLLYLWFWEPRLTLWTSLTVPPMGWMRQKYQQSLSLVWKLCSLKQEHVAFLVHSLCWWIWCFLI